MLKTEAIELLGGTVTAVSKAIGISPAAVSQWPDNLTDSIRDRVQAALFRRTACAPMEKSHAAPASRAQAATETVADSDGNEMRDMLTAQRDRAADRVAADPNDRLSALILENRNDALKELAHTPANRAQAATETVAPSSHQADPLDLEHSDQERRDGGRRESERRDGQRRGEEVVVGGV